MNILQDQTVREPSTSGRGALHSDERQMNESVVNILTYAVGISLGSAALLEQQYAASGSVCGVVLSLLENVAPEIDG